MRVSHHPGFALPLPPSHPFPTAKYRLIREVLLARGVIRESDIDRPEEAPLEVLRRVHTEAYLAKLESGGLTAAEQRRLGVPWSPELWVRSRRATAGTLLAARRALDSGLGANLAGGTHHAFADHGEGFCVLNDVAVAIRALQAEDRVSRVLVVDLDVHQGNGTASIFEGDPSVFTFSIHGAGNYPAEKLRSTLDVGLADGTGDDEYLAALGLHLPAILKGFAADLVFYLAGVDVAAGDRYGRFRLTDGGIRARDRQVLELARRAGLPLVITLAGGYAATAERTAALHSIVFEEAAALERAAGLDSVRRDHRGA
jgi:acetoin utilization deacetylase AcuC-like enzyme